MQWCDGGWAGVERGRERAGGRPLAPALPLPFPVGTLLPPAPGARQRILAPAAALAPFVAPAGDASARRPLGVPPPPPGPLSEAPRLLPGVAIAVFYGACDADAVAVPARLMGLLPVQAAAAALARAADAGFAPAWRPADAPAAAAWFAVLETEAQPPAEAAAAAARLWAVPAPPPAPGARLLAAGAPLGGLAPSLFGCVTFGGAVAAWLAEGGGGGGAPPPPLLLADLPPAAAGADGGPVVRASDGRLVGVLAPPLVAGPGGGGPGSSLPLVVAAGPLAAALAAWRPLAGEVETERPSPAAAAAAAGPTRAAAAEAPTSRPADAVVALLAPGVTWAAAVHVGGGAFVTAAHAVPGEGVGGGHAALAVQLRRPDAPPVWAAVTADPPSFLPPCCAGLDVAVVRLTGRPPAALPPAATLARAPPRPGDPLTVAGFPHVHPRAGLGPLTTAGCAGRVAAAGTGGCAELLLCTASVVPGASGGAVFDAGGRVAGVAVSNTRVVAGCGGEGGRAGGGAPAAASDASLRAPIHPQQRHRAPPRVCGRRPPARRPVADRARRRAHRPRRPRPAPAGRPGRAVGAGGAAGGRRGAAGGAGGAGRAGRARGVEGGEAVIAGGRPAVQLRCQGACAGSPAAPAGGAAALASLARSPSLAPLPPPAPHRPPAPLPSPHPGPA